MQYLRFLIEECASYHATNEVNLELNLVFESNIVRNYDINKWSNYYDARNL